MRDWEQSSSHGEGEINMALKLESSQGQCYYGLRLHHGTASPIQGLQNASGDRAYPFAQARQNSNRTVDGVAC